MCIIYYIKPYPISVCLPSKTVYSCGAASDNICFNGIITCDQFLVSCPAPESILRASSSLCLLKTFRGQLRSKSVHIQKHSEPTFRLFDKGMGAWGVLQNYSSCCITPHSTGSGIDWVCAFSLCLCWIKVYCSYMNSVMYVHGGQGPDRTNCGGLRRQL